MAMVCVTTTEGKEHKAQGNVKSIFKMISLLADDEHQLIINKKELDDFVNQKKLEICNLLPKELSKDIIFDGTVNCACGACEGFHAQLYYIDFSEKFFYIIFRIVINGKDVYNNPKSVKKSTGTIELTL